MKMSYEKPMVAIENYVLSQTVAACSIKVNYKDSGCVYNDEDMITYQYTISMAMGGFFLADHCTYAAENMSSGDGLCYNTSTNSMFVS